MDWYNEIPKVELHVHLEGAIPHNALFELIMKYGGDPSVPDMASLEKRFEFRDINGFFKLWTWNYGFLREYEDFTYIAEHTARDMERQGIRYAEVMFSPSLFVKKGLDVQKLTEAVRKGLSRTSGIEIALIADLVRDYGPDSEMVTLKQLEEVRDYGVTGIGIGGTEHEFPAELFTEHFEEARKTGFHTNAHAGESAGAKSIWDTIRILQPERIGHGTRAGEDSELVRYLAENKIPLEMCPGSNVRTGVARDISEHPVRKFFDAGMIVSINTDDPKMFGTSLAGEFRMLEENLGFTKQEICILILNAIESSWLPEERKESLKIEFKRHPAWKD